MKDPIETATRPCRSCYQLGYTAPDFDFWCSTCAKAVPNGPRVVALKTTSTSTGTIEIAFVDDPNHVGAPMITFSRVRPPSLFRRLVDHIRRRLAFRRVRARVVKR